MHDTKKSHVSEAKKKLVKELEVLMKKKTIMIVSTKSLPSAQFQDIKKKLRGKAKILVAKKNLIDRAIDNVNNEELKKLNLYPKWRIVLGGKKPNKRMDDVELILRFFSLYNGKYNIEYSNFFKSTKNKKENGCYTCR